MIWIFLLVALAVLVLGSYTDFRTREVPDWVNYGLIFTGVGLHGILSAVSWNWLPILSSGIGLGIGMGVAFAMYYLGQWGGGDAKMLMGLGALIGFDFSYDSFLLSFLINAFLLGALYGLGYGVFLAVKNKKKFRETYRKLRSFVPAILRRGIVICWIAAVLLAIVFLFWNNFLLIYLGAIIVMLLVFYHLYLFAKSIEKCCMLKYVSPDKLTEGDWIVHDVYVKGKRVCGPKDLGILKKQINILKRARIKKILVKDGIPFVPSFLIAFVMTMFAGNVLFYLFSIV